MQRQQLSNFTDLIDDERDLRLAEAQEQRQGTPLPKQGRVVNRRRVVNAFLRRLVDEQGEPIRQSKEDLERALAPVIARYLPDLKHDFSLRPDRCQSATATAKHVLTTVGLRLATKQDTVKGKKVRSYQLDSATYDQQRVLREQRLAMLRQLRAEEQVDR